jgi:hypothetical protein
MDQFELGRIVS